MAIVDSRSSTIVDSRSSTIVDTHPVTFADTYSGELLGVHSHRHWVSIFRVATNPSIPGTPAAVVVGVHNRKQEGMSVDTQQIFPAGFHDFACSGCP